MSISTARPQLIEITKKHISSAGLRVACYAMQLYVLCISAPAIYLANPSIRGYGEQDRNARTLINNHLSFVHQKHLAVLAEAHKLDDPAARTAFLRDALEQANRDLVGIEELSRCLPTSFTCSDMWFHRIPGNRIVASQQRETRWHESRHRLARRYVEDLNHALRLCSAP